jgi:alkaline phosphatase
MGPASMTMARDYVRFAEARETLSPDAHFVGSVATAATDNRVTDSAASATAYSAGVRTYNGAIAVDTAGMPVGTVLQAAKARGMKTGLVATTRITHATPAAFSAHVPRRSMENEIAEQQAASGVDVLIGGGRRHFEPSTTPGSRRADARDLLAEMQSAGYTIATTPAELAAQQTTPVAALLAQDQLNYEIDRPASEPSLAEITEHALRLLGGHPEGFFLMVEASRIDHAGHGNDPAAHLHDILAFERAWDVAMRFARADGNTLVVSTADHETGGLTLGRDGVYAWEPAVLQPVTASVDSMAALLGRGLTPADVLARTAAIDSLTPSEIGLLNVAARDANPRALPQALVHLISDRAGLGWTSGGHTAVDVNVYAFGPGADRFVGHRTNAAFGRTLADVMGLDLDAQTARVRAAR